MAKSSSLHLPSSSDITFQDLGVDYTAAMIRPCQIGRSCALCCLLASASTLADKPRIASIDTYGLREVSEADVRKALEIEIGKPLPHTPDELMRRLEAIPGVVRGHLDYTLTSENKFVLQVGIDETGSSGLEFRAAPRGDAELSREVLESSRNFDAAFEEAVEKGEMRDDFSQGHSLMVYPAARAAQERFIVDAEKHLTELRKVLHTSTDPDQRAIAAQVIGYAADKRAVVGDLLQAVRDPDEGVRNNAARALACVSFLAAEHPDLDIEIDPSPFIEMLNSIVWTDRNKAMFVLQGLTKSRDPEILQQLREQAMPGLVEMARWKSAYAMQAYTLLGRLAGLSDEQIKEGWDWQARERAIDKIVKSQQTQK
jgi:hypothetical protein